MIAAAVLDADTCAACRARHGQPVKAGGPIVCEYVKNDTGICRCVAVEAKTFKDAEPFEVSLVSKEAAARNGLPLFARILPRRRSRRVR